MAAQGNIVQSGFSRVWLLQNRAGPGINPEYQGLWRAGAVSWKQGDVKTIRVPNPGVLDSFVRIGKIRGDPGDPQLPITARYVSDLSRLLKLVRQGCDSDLQVHIGKCSDPRDFNKGWEKVLVLEGAVPTDYKTSELGALEPSQRNMVDEDVPFTGEEYYEIGRMNFAEQAASQVTQEIVDIVVADAIACGACGISSDGCQVVLAVSKRAGGSPGTGADLLYTQNGGSTWAFREITTLTGSNNPNAIGAVGSYVFVVSANTVSLMYATLSDLLNGAETWSNITTGFVTAGKPRAVYVFDPANIWIVSEAGYIYKSGDITAGVSVQDAGVATAQNYNAVAGIDQLHVIAVGDSNAVAVTNNGGSTWTAITGPAVGVNLNAVWMLSDTEWLIGTAGGKLFYTTNSGVTWTEKPFPGSGSGVVYSIKFATPTVGFMSHATSAPRGRILRTIDGGHSWYVLPETGVTLVDNDRLNALSTCDPNVVFGAGLGANATDGIIVKGAA
jgi:photosystem II stability/assembly factor-like uncharacterized protein